MCPDDGRGRVPAPPSRFGPVWAGCGRHCGTRFPALLHGTEGRKKKQEKALALLCARADTTARSAGGFREQGLTLFRNAQTTIDAVSRETDEYPRRCGTCADAITDLGGI